MQNWGVRILATLGACTTMCIGISQHVASLVIHLAVKLYSPIQLSIAKLIMVARVLTRVNYHQLNTGCGQYLNDHENVM
jgi:hypothetical protein